MTKAELKNRITRVKGLSLKDPWGDQALVDRLDLDGDSVWLIYEGLNVPFERALDDMVLAANGHYRTDKSEQFNKLLLIEPGLVATFNFERFWASTWVEPKIAQQPHKAVKRPFKKRR